MTTPPFWGSNKLDTFVAQSFQIDTPGSWSGSSAGSTLTSTVDNFSALAEGENLVGLEVEIVDTDGSTSNAKAIISAYDSSSGVTFKSLNTKHVALADGDTVYVIGNAQGEGTGSPTSWSTQPRVVWNSTQIEKTSLKITGTLYKMAKLRATKLNELVRLQQNKAREHVIQRERKLLFGERVNGNDAPLGHLTDSNGNLIRTTMGIIPAFETYGITSGDAQNVFTASVASYDFDDFVEDTAKMFQYIPNDGTLTAQCGMDAMNFWSKVGSGTGFIGNTGKTINISESGQGKIGYNYKELESPSGMIRLVWNPLLRNRYKGHMILLDKGTVNRVIYRDAMYQTAIQDNDYDGQKDQYFSDEGLGIQNLKKNSMMILS